MAEKERTFGNWVNNVITSPWKLLHTWGAFVTDSVNTVTWVVEDVASPVKTTMKQIVDCFSYDKKWYQKILNIPVAAWIGLVWAVKTVVTPIVNTATRVGETALNLTTNTWKSTFWSVFSAKPTSDISFNTIKTKKKWVIKIDTSKFVLDPNKSWVPNRWTWSKSKKKAVSTVAAWAAAWTAAAWISAATAAAISNKEISNLKDTISGLKKDFAAQMKEMKDSFTEKMSKVLKENDTLKAENKNVKDENAKLKKTLEALQKEKAQKASEEWKAEKKVEEPKAEKKPEAPKVEEKVEEPKVEKKTEEPKVEKKPEAPKVEEKVEEPIVEKKESNRIPEFIKDNRWKSMINYLNREHPEIKIKYNKSDNEWHLYYWKDSRNQIIVWTKDKEEVPQILLHEVSHLLVDDDVYGVDSLLDEIENMQAHYGKPLSLVAANNKKYQTPEAKKIEDACELIALYARWDWAFDKYMLELQSWKNGKLAKLEKADADYLKDLCEDIISEINTVKMHVKAPVKVAA